LAFPAGWSIKSRWDSFYRSFVPGLILPGQLARAMRDKNDDDAGCEERRLAALAYDDESGLPGADLAWKIGQTFRKPIDLSNHKRLRYWKPVVWSSGPAALWLSGRFADFVGLVGTIWQTDSLMRRHHFLDKFLDAATLLRFISPDCDVQPDEKLEKLYFTLSHLCTRQGLAELSRSMAYGFSYEDLLARNKEHRALAREQWMFNDEEAAALDEAWARWCTTRKAQRHWDRGLKLAFRLSSAPEFDAVERERITIFCLKDVTDVPRKLQYPSLDDQTDPRNLFLIPFEDPDAPVGERQEDSPWEPPF
jgi:hypothetical protein